MELEGGKPRPRTRENERGQLVPLIAFGIVGIVGMVALTVDVGYWRYQQREIQAAADAAAVAGAVQRNYPTAAFPTTPTLAAQASATKNGFTDGSNNVTVAVDVNPAAPARAGATPYPATAGPVKVTISATQPAFFSGIFNATPPTISASAVAVATADYSACLYQLEQTGAGGEITFKGNKPIETVGCGVLANGKIDAGFASTTTSIGYYDTINSSYGGPESKLQSPVDDPCFKIPACSYLKNQPIPPAAGGTDMRLSVAVTAPPAPGYKVISGNCCNNGTVFGPGLYYVYGDISGTITGDGVTIVNVDGKFLASGLGVAHPYFSAPSTGPTAGMAYYQPPSNTNGLTLNGGGNGTSIWDGIFYAPAARFVSNGGSTTFSYVVVGAIRENGGGSGLGIVVDPTLGSLIPPNSQVAPTHVVIDQ